MIDLNLKYDPPLVNLKYYIEGNIYVPPNFSRKSLGNILELLFIKSMDIYISDYDAREKYKILGLDRYNTNFLNLHIKAELSKVDFDILYKKHIYKNINISKLLVLYPYITEEQDQFVFRIVAQND